MRRHAWNCDLSTKPGTDILTNRHIYIYIYIVYIYPLSAHSRGHCMIRLNSPFRLSQHSPHLDDCCIQSRLGLSSGSALHLADQVQASRKGYPSQCGKNPPVLRTWRADILSEIRFAKNPLRSAQWPCLRRLRSRHPCSQSWHDMWHVDDQEVGGLGGGHPKKSLCNPMTFNSWSL